MPDASPNASAKWPLYIHRPLLNADEVRGWARRQGFATALPAGDMHVTVVFSREPVEWDLYYQPARIMVDGGDREVVKFGDATVLCFNSPELFTRWRSYVKRGASWDFDSYRPHVTITYKHAGGVTGVKPYEGLLVFGPERKDTIREDAGEDVRETSTAA